METKTKNMIESDFLKKVTRDAVFKTGLSRSILFEYESKEKLKEEVKYSVEKYFDNDELETREILLDNYSTISVHAFKKDSNVILNIELYDEERFPIVRNFLFLKGIVEKQKEVLKK